MLVKSAQPHFTRIKDNHFTFMKCSSHILATLLVLLGITSLALAQQNPSDSRITTAQGVDQQQNLGKTMNNNLDNQELVPEVSPGETADTGPQVILKRKLHRNLFEVDVDEQHYYTSNVFLQKDRPGSGPLDTSVNISTVDMAFAPDSYELGDDIKLSPRVGHRYQWYNYSLESGHQSMGGLIMHQYDFDAETTYGNLDTHLPEDWVVSTGFQWQRLMGHDSSIGDYYEFYREYTPTWGVSHPFMLQNKILLNLAYGGAYRWTEAYPPDRNRNDRLDESFTISYIQELYPRLTMELYGQYLFSNYTNYQDLATNQNSHRQDDTYSTGLTLQYTFNDWSSIRTFISYAHGETTTPNLVDRYDSFNGGLGGSLVFHF